MSPEPFLSLSLHILSSIKLLKMLLLSRLHWDSWFKPEGIYYMVALQNMTLVSLNHIVNPILFLSVCCAFYILWKITGFDRTV